MTEREARIAFNMIPTVGAVTLARLMRETHGSAAAAYEFYPEKKDWEGKPLNGSAKSSERPSRMYAS